MFTLFEQKCGLRHYGRIKGQATNCSNLNLGLVSKDSNFFFPQAQTN